MSKYEFTLKHDTGKMKITTCARSIVKAIEIICSNEGCPQSAIERIKLLNKC